MASLAQWSCLVPLILERMALRRRILEVTAQMAAEAGHDAWLIFDDDDTLLGQGTLTEN